MSDFFGEDDSVEKNNSYTGDDDLITNTSRRLPVCLCLDISGSMKKNDAISALNEGVEAFYQAIREDEQARNSCEIAVITFNSEVKIAEEFSTVDKKGKVHFTAEGGTALAHAVNRALDLLEERKNSYKANGVDYYQPWLVIITDGKPGDPEDIPQAQSRTKKLAEERKLTLFPIAVGSDDNEEKYRQVMDVLNGFSNKSAKHLKDLKFSDFFEWLGKSVTIVSASKVGDKVRLDTTGMDDWAEI